MTQEEFENRITNLQKEDLLSSLQEFHSILWDAFLDAQVKTNEAVRGAHNRRSVKNFYPMSMRFHVLNFISQKGISSRLLNEKDEEIEGELDEKDWKPDVLANNGIGGWVKGYEFRILKMYRGGLPPAVSGVRKEFYNQSHLKLYQPSLPPPLGDVNQDYFTLKPHVIYLWSITKRKLSLHYAIPKHYTLYASTELINIPNPLTEISEVSVPQEIPHAEVIAHVFEPLQIIEEEE